VIEINFADVVEVPGLDSELLVLWLSEVVSLEGFECGDVDVVFCSDEYLLVLNNRYLQHDFYTDIVTFDYCVGTNVRGELYISIDRVLENSRTFRSSFLDELRRVCVHGVLHLCGYGDKSDNQILVMRSKEQYYLDLYVSRET
jgi:probable rRNA maturation factor